MTVKIRKLRTILFIGTTMTIFFLIPSGSANDPSEMILDYNENTDQLDVTITHSVGGMSNHFIQTVQIKINYMLNQTHNYIAQMGDIFTYNYDVIAEPGATIEVHYQALCLP